MKPISGHIKLGIFVIAGLAFLVLLLYMIGRNQNLFGSHLTIKAVFTDADGLKPGNNVRYAGIEIGTVTYVHFLSDTTVEVAMTVATQAASVIHRNAVASVGTDGLVGNRILNIKPGESGAQTIRDGDYLSTKPKVNLDNALQTLSHTNDDVAEIAEQLKTTVRKINESTALWKLLNDRSIPLHLQTALRNIATVTARANNIAGTMETAVADAKNGKGLLATLLYDTAISVELKRTVMQFRKLGTSADSLVGIVQGSVNGLNAELMHGKGVAHDLIRDTSLAGRLARSLQNIEKGTDGFNQNMEALKHNFLFSGYFKKLEKQRLAEEKKKNNKK
ncbi:MCE family protein [Sediminibacterium roseum]|uniref:MCE family protein n=1 Tax=Sediminibacterium roseum TaxID=1978412 RepID=A0ABW9ZY03_9BACT|nr:MlaD family protein [Sediminibacterium roseum]NCI52049.1 MCE family protein [Sediminibacterium roseum]